MGWCDSMSTAADDVEMKEKLQIHQEPRGDRGEKSGGKPDNESDKQLSQPYWRVKPPVKPFWKKRVDVRMVFSFIGERFDSVILRVFSCFRPSPPRLMPLAAPDDPAEDYEDGGKILLHRESGLAPCVHVTLVKKNNHVDINDNVSCIGDGVQADPADSPAVIVHPQERISALFAEVVASASDTDVVEVAAEEATTVNFGSSEDSIEVGPLSRSDFELILVLCPSFG